MRTVHGSQKLSHKVFATLCFVLLAALSLQAQLPPPPVQSPTPTVTNPDAAGLNIIARPGQWSTSDGSAVDVACTAGETEITDASGGRLCVIGTHGNIGVIQCMPPNGVFAGSGAQQLLCSVCYAGTPTTGSGEGSVAQCIAQLQGVPCESVIACTGSVEPIGNNGTCAESRCHGIWVNGCTPPVAIRPSTPGVCYTNADPQPPAAPIAAAVTVGCFANDLPSDVWQRCRNSYSTFVTVHRSWPFSDRTCADEWADADITSQGFQECQALVRSCIGQTRAACDAMAVAASLRHRAPEPLVPSESHDAIRPAVTSQPSADGNLQLRQ